MEFRAAAVSVPARLAQVGGTDTVRLGRALLNSPIAGARADLQFRLVSYSGANCVEQAGSVQFWLETDYVLPVDFIGYGVNRVFQSTLL